MNVLCFSVTPSPYQRDFFNALANRWDCDLQVRYFEKSADDSPWNCAEFESWESVMSGRVLGRGRVRCHWNSPLPEICGFDAVVVNAPLTGITTQRLFRRLNRTGAPSWFFWGEQLLPRHGWRGIVQRQLAAPLAAAKAIVAIGKTAQADYQRRFPRVPIYNIPYTCDLTRYKMPAQDRKPVDFCRFLFAGQMIARKGVDVLLAAFSQIVNDGAQAELHLVGREGELPRWLGALDEAARARVVYHGFAQPDELPARFAAADVFVLPSRHDGWGVVVNQALGAGMPVITSTAAGAGRDLVLHGKNGLHVPPGDIAALAEAMRELAEDPTRRTGMARAASETAARLSPERAAEKWMELMKQ